ncbi:AAA family ATPase [Terribacillus sp. DMT04]|uniref:AAA family ATPase n=1 Tax=Terribacillus sp. DMT04 TaxID=2850441 RepID=UPI001C2BF6E8|nr:AAA family ATPase [Terribacillus sp. DMT04]QXE02661.1 AAA family ATPase [Terribacillus sp. DMT04]
MNMRISGGHIYDFGKLHDFTFDFADQSLVIVHGENETGKSTLKAFLIYILFGMRPRELQRYLPRTGGTPGGRLKLLFPEGEVMVERIQDRHNGQAVCYTKADQKDQQWLERQLGGLDAAVYKQVFTLDTETLSSLQLTNKEQLGRVLLEAGQAGTAAIHKLEKKLLQDLQQLYRPQGRKPEINSMLRAFAEQEQHVRQLHNKEETYLPDKEKLQETAAKIVELQNEKADLRRQIPIQKQSLQAVPWLKKAILSREQLRQLEHIEAFPPDGMKRMQELQIQLQPLEAQAHVQQQEAERLNNDLLSIEEQQIEEAAYYQLQKLIERSDWRGQFARLEKLQETAAKLQMEARARKLHYAFPERYTSNMYRAETKEQWRLLREQVMIHNAEREHTEKAVTVKKQEIDKVNTFQERLQQNLIPEKEYRQLHDQRDHDNLHSPSANERFAIKMQVILSILLAGSGIIMTSWILAASGIILLGGALLLWRLEKKNTTVQSETSSYVEEKVREQQELRLRWRQLEEQRHPLEVQLADLQQEQNMQFLAYQKLNAQETAHMERYPFLQAIPLSDWEKAVREWEWKEQLDQEIQRVNHELEQLQCTYTSVVEQAGTIVGLSESLPTREIMQEAEYVMERQRKLRHGKEQLLVQTADIRHRMGTLAEQLNPLREQKAMLLAAVGAEDDKQFQNLSELYLKRKQLEADVQHYDMQARSFLPEEELAAEEPDCLQEEAERKIAELETKLEAVEEELDVCRKQVAMLEFNLAAIESDTAASSAYHELQYQRQELLSAGRKWMVRKLAFDMLLQTKRAFQEDRFPDVLAEASRLFSKVTTHYEQLLLTESGSLVVKDCHGREFSVESLSNGTVEQLYLCLRLALSRKIGSIQAFPLLIDDAFSHSDQKRRAMFYSILQEEKNAQQFILFSWEEPAAELSQQAKVLCLKKMQETYQ